jgi:hypothetical protein
MLERHDLLAMGAGRSRNGCPPHGPHLVNTVEEDLYEARCLNCGLVGPTRKDPLAAKLAFDQRWHQVCPG